MAEKRLKGHMGSLLGYGLGMIVGRSPLFCSTLIDQSIGHYWTVPIFLILVCIAWLPGLLHIIRFRRELKRGAFPENTTYPSPTKAHAQFIARFLPMLWLFFGIWTTSLGTARYGESLTLETAASLPYVTVADLFPDAQVEYTDEYNSIFQWETESAVCVEFTEDFRLTFPDGTTVTGYWTLNRYETAFDWIAAGAARETRFIDWLRRNNTLLPLTLEEADWVRAYHVHNPRWHRLPHDQLLIQKDNVFLQCTLLLYGDVSEYYTMEELGALLLAHEYEAKEGMKQ